MDTIRFSVEKADSGAGSTVAIWINSCNFLEIVRDVEMPFALKEGHPNMAGQYAQLSLADISDLWAHFHGDTLPYFSEDNKTHLFGCVCGEPGCWPLQAYIGIGRNTGVSKLYRLECRDSGCKKHPAGKGRCPPGGRAYSERLPPGGRLFFFAVGFIPTGPWPELGGALAGAWPTEYRHSPKHSHPERLRAAAPHGTLSCLALAL